MRHVPRLPATIQATQVPLTGAHRSTLSPRRSTLHSSRAKGREDGYSDGEENQAADIPPVTKECTLRSLEGRGALFSGEKVGPSWLGFLHPRRAWDDLGQ